MPTPFESAQLLLTLYDLRREETMRIARDFFISFDPHTLEDYMAGVMGPNGAHIRMVVTYWDMACSFVVNGAIDEKMFRDAGGEYILVFGKIEPLLPQIREAFGSQNFAANLEKVALNLPDARTVIDAMAARIRGLIAARAAMQGAN
jgi:hypothetical protein